MSKKRVVYIPIGPEENLIIQPYLIIELLFNLNPNSSKDQNAINSSFPFFKPTVIINLVKSISLAKKPRISLQDSPDIIESTELFKLSFRSIFENLNKLNQHLRILLL